MSLTSLLASIAVKAAGVESAPSAQGPDAPDPALVVLQDIRRASQLADSLSLYSDNDGLDDLPTSTLRPLLLHSVWAEVETRVRTKPGDVDARRTCLQSAKSHYLTYIKTLFDLGVFSSSSSSSSSSSQQSPLHLLASLLRPYATSASSSSSSGSTSMPTNPHQRRELKVALFKLERSFKSALDEYRHAAREKAGLQAGAKLSVPGAGATSAGGNSTETVAQEPDEAQWDWLVLPKRAKRNERGEGSDDEDEDEDEGSDAFVMPGGSKAASSSGSIETPHSLRAYLVLLLRYHALLALNNLGFIDDELNLLANIPASAQRDAAERQAREEAEAERRMGGGNDDFRVETRFDAAAPGPLMDDKGKPLRPFTITSGQGGAAGSGSGSASSGNLPIRELNERQRIRDGVFRPHERLPTMSIDEYLAEEQRRGNVLTGGGAEGAAKATPREERSLRAEMDGTREGREAQDEEREEKIEWDRFTEQNKRGAGNTMNRG